MLIWHTDLTDNNSTARIFAFQNYIYSQQILICFQFVFWPVAPPTAVSQSQSVVFQQVASYYWTAVTNILDYKCLTLLKQRTAVTNSNCNSNFVIFLSTDVTFSNHIE